MRFDASGCPPLRPLHPRLRSCGRRGRSAVLSGALTKPVRAGARGGWRLIGRVRWSPWPGGRRDRFSRARRSSVTAPERVGALGGPHRIPILVLWEDRSAPHPAASAPQPRNHAEIAERIRCAGPNDPPRAPYPAPGGLRGSRLLRLVGPRDPCGGSGRGDAARPHPERPAGGPRRHGPGRRRGGKRWPAHNFRVLGGSCAHEEWRHSATSGLEGCWARGERYAPATFLSRRTAPPPIRPRSRWGERDEWGRCGECGDDPCATAPTGAPRAPGPPSAGAVARRTGGLPAEMRASHFERAVPAGRRQGRVRLRHVRVPEEWSVRLVVRGSLTGCACGRWNDSSIASRRPERRRPVGG